MNSDTEQSANGLDDLTPEQLVILHEKMELEKLLEVTKNLQQQANLFFSTKETSSTPTSASREQKKPNASESSESRGASRLQCSSNNDEFSQIAEANRFTVTSEPPQKHHADKTEGAKVPSMKHGTVCENPDSGGSGDPLSLLGNVRLLEENAELLQKKIELEVLLHRAKILLERTGLLEASDNAGGDEFSMENDNVEKISETRSTLDSNVGLQTLADDNSGMVYSNNNIEEYSESNVEAFYERASELTSGTTSLLDVVHQNKAPCSKESPEENKNGAMLNFDEDLKQASTRDASDHFSESEIRPDIDEFEREHVETTDNNNQTEPYDKYTIQRLLYKADLLLEQANRPRWSAENASKEANSDDLQGISVKQDFKEATSTEENEENKQIQNDDVGVASAARDQANTETEVLHTIANEESIAARLGQEFSKVPDQADESTDEDDDDDPSFDAKFHLQQLLQRAKTVLERSKLPARERLGEYEGLDASQPTTEETPKRLENISDVSASKTESLNNENKADALDFAEKPPENYETVSLEKLSATQTTDASETDFDSLTQDAQLEFLIRTTSALKQKADTLIDQINEPENPSSSNTSTQENHEGTTNGHRPTENTMDSKHEYPITTQLNRTVNRPTSIGENIRSVIFETAEFRQDTEGCQAEYEEVEESQLQINENDKSPLEIEDEYASDGSDMCGMMQYYEDNGSSSEEETDFSETQIDGIEAELRQLQKVTDLLVVNSEFANETLATRQPQDNSTTSGTEYLKQSVPICNSHNEKETLAHHLQQTPGAFNNYSASSETEFLSSTGDASQAPADKDGTVGDLANEDDDFDERAELRLLLEKTKLLLEQAKQPQYVEKKETETVTNICPDDINIIKHTKDSTANEDSALKSDEISEIPCSTNQGISTGDTKTFDHAEVTQPQRCNRSPENAAENTLISEKQSSCELQVISPVLRPESEEFADEKVLCSVKEQETSQATVFNVDDVINKQDRLVSVANSSELLSAQLTQIKAEINTILQEASAAEVTDSLETKIDLESSFNCNNAAKPRKNEEEPKIPDTLCSGHSISKDIEVAADQQRVCETNAESSHTGTGVPETDAAQTNGAETGEHSSGSEPKGLNSLSSLTKLLSLQKDMARMQLHLSNLQDSMRTTSATLQELLDEAFSEM